ncbi:MAG: DUF3592 domain-containing protein [Candidatus Obscuribacterales bacterium]|nr:DUF3592 domain-containing protein [Candidatus Obscuribacterales bacterium]
MSENRIKPEIKVSSWPSPQDYFEAVQSPLLSFSDPDLQHANPELDALGLPKPVSGGFASVYRLYADEKDKDWAVRFFLRNIPDQQERYERISTFILNDTLPYTVDFKYVATGVRASGDCFPLLKMDWVHGETLDQYIRNHAFSTEKMSALCSSFLTMHRELRAAGIAHGDLQHGNILITPSGELRLVDYDGMYVPSMSGWKSAELGHVNYQHPLRDANCFDERMDNFSSLLLLASLKAITAAPHLIEQHNGLAECLLIRSTDFQSPERSPVFYSLENECDAESRHLSRLLRMYLSRTPQDVPFLDELPSTIPGDLPPAVGPIELRAEDTTPEAVEPTPNEGPQTSHCIEPELTQQIPRKTCYNHRQHRVSPFPKQLGLLCLPHLWVFGVLPLLCSLTMSAVDATIIKCDRSGGYGYGTMIYSYTINGHDIETSVPKPGEAVIEKFENLKHIRVRDSWLLPGLAASIEGGPKQGLAFPIAVPILVILSAIFVSGLIWKEPVQHRRLARRGTPVSGRFKRKDMEKNQKGTKYHSVTFTYEWQGSYYSNSMKVSEQDYANIAPGNAVTVLLDPLSPEDSVVYPLSFFTAKD